MNCVPTWPLANAEAMWEHSRMVILRSGLADCASLSGGDDFRRCEAEGGDDRSLIADRQRHLAAFSRMSGDRR